MENCIHNFLSLILLIVPGVFLFGIIASEELFTPEELAKPWKVSTAFIYKLTRLKILGSYHIGKSLRISGTHAQEYLESVEGREYYRDRFKRKENGRDQENGINGNQVNQIVDEIVR